LNPYALLTGFLFVMIFVTHGSLWLATRGGADLGDRALRGARPLWLATALAAVAFLFWSGLGINLEETPVWGVNPIAAVASLGLTGIWIFRRRARPAFVSSCATIVFLVLSGFVGLFPDLIRSRLDPESSLTIFNASSSPYTLKVMTIVAVIIVPVVIAYQAWVYRVFRGKPPSAY
jgi:cytochrome d ubiquinol oxidase subunit II